MSQNKLEKEKLNAIDNDKSDKDIVDLAKKRFKLCETAEEVIRKDALDDLEFRLGNQWPEHVKQERANSARPVLTINKMPQYVRQISNEMRKNKPSIRVYPVDDTADIDTAKIYQGVVRSIEYSSNADLAYISAGEGAVEKSFGFFRIRTDYVSHDSFDQEIKIEPIANHFSVYLDKDHQKIDGSDAAYGFVFDDISKDQFYVDYPDSKIAKENTWAHVQDGEWFREETVRVAEYFYKEYKRVKIFQVRDPNGTILTLTKEELATFQEQGLVYETLQEREVLKPSIKWCKINGEEILERTEWLGSWIPIIPVYGSRVNVNGRWVLESLIRHAKDSQTMLNYMVSSEAEAIGLAPKAPYIVAEGQITKEYENQWATANVKNYATLTYKPTTLNGQPVASPQRQTFEPAVMAITQARVQANDDIKSTTGIYDASMGAQSNEISGIAIARRNAQAQTSNYHFIDNLARSIQHAGRIIVELIPKIYDTARVVRIIGEDEEQEIVKINQEFEKNGKPVTYAMNKGKYDVVVDVGPSYDTKRQEAAATMVELTKSYPEIMKIAGDMMLRNMDLPQAKELADRFKKTISPDLLANDNDKVPPQIKAQLQQMGQVIEMMTQKMNEQNEIIKTKAMEIESKERIEFAKLNHDATIEMAKLDSAEAMEALRQDMSLIQSRLSKLDFEDEFDEDLNELGGNEAAITQEPNQEEIEQ